MFTHVCVTENKKLNLAILNLTSLLKLKKERKEAYYTVHVPPSEFGNWFYDVHIAFFHQLTVSELLFVGLQDHHFPPLEKGHSARYPS